MSTEVHRGSGSLLTPGHPQPTISAARDLAVVTVAVWLAAFVIHHFRIPEALDAWNRAHEQWAIDEVTLVSLCAVAGLGVFSWRRWQESLRTIARHQATLQRLRTTESEIASKDQLIRTVSHELRTPLTAILGYAELLGESRDRSVDRDEMITTILRQGRDLSDIVEDLLTRAQSEAKTLKVVAVPVNLVANVNQVLESWNSAERARVTVSGSPAGAVGDPARVRQIVRNLLTNALRYGAGAIEVATGVRASGAWLAVSDEGPGIPAEEAERVFEPYHRVGVAPTAPGSIGLGLAISRELARLMGGDLTYRRVRGRTVFELGLPVNPEYGAD
ncbi:MAG: HAMP domain-containing histidine kinase [Acidimicrobiia bacterium]|nr:HAMP domain-containing histidine kinase [Acidimicrobiia bacterium]